MAKDEEFHVEKSGNPAPKEGERRIIDEANYKVHAKKQSGPSAIGKGGDPLPGAENTVAGGQKFQNSIEIPRKRA